MKKVEVKDQVTSNDFEAIRLLVASPEAIIGWSHGEVLKPETINYRTQKPERDGLFDERIFGPTKDWECYCGKYRKIRYKGVVCDKCGVEVTRSSVRRVRMGHIDLAVPVAHIWYVRGMPSILGLVLDIPVSALEKVIYFASFVVTSVDEKLLLQSLNDLKKDYEENRHKEINDNTDKGSLDLRLQRMEAAYKKAKSDLESLKVGTILSETRFHEFSINYGSIIKVNIGAEAILELLDQIDLPEEIKKLKIDIENTTGANKRKYLKRLKVLTNMESAEVSPSWLILKRLPVLPPDLRPMVQLDGGRFAASDLNDLYRRVLNRNNRLKRLVNQGAPEVICRNEKRMLQEAVDSLIDNSAKQGKAAQATGNRRKLRSLSDMLRGKQGRFRQNLLGKRVDYSGRSVIVVGPNLKLNECGLPKIMALELFKPFVVGRLIADGYVHNVKNATRLIEKGEPFVWDILEQITENHHVLLNRAPTLHRLGIQAFKPKLIEGRALQIHPLVCTAFNADFDGDQMAVHIPLSEQAQEEAAEIMLSSKNLLKPSSGEPVVTPQKDIVLGCYYLSSIKEGSIGENRYFSSPEEAVSNFHLGKIKLRAKIKVRIAGKICETSVGRIILNSVFPESVEFQNYLFDRKKVSALVARIFSEKGVTATSKLVDDLKDIGFQYSGFSGITFSVDDIQVPESKKKIIAVAEEKLTQINHQYQRGLITNDERYAKTIDLWMTVQDQLEKEMLKNFDKDNDINIIFLSGARGSVTQINQIAGMKGLVANPSGEIIELPIRSNFKEGLSVFEYFLSSHGSRKGRADTALRTSEAGYLTRRLVDVSQDTIISEKDCRTSDSFLFEKAEIEKYGEKLAAHIVGRVLAEDIKNWKKGEIITNEIADSLDSDEKVKEVKVRNLLTCGSERGVCQNCYGVDLATGKLAEVGSVIGIVAAQAIGEPGTQLTMRTFHVGGAAGEDIVSGLPRVQELFEARNPRIPAVLAEIAGRVKISDLEDEKIVEIHSDEYQSQEIVLSEKSKPTVADGDSVKIKDIIAHPEGGKPIRATIDGKVMIKDEILTITNKKKFAVTYHVSKNATLLVENDAKIAIGDQITEGHLDLSENLRLSGLKKTQSYIMREVQAIYASQGQDINDKHLEVIIRQMSSKVKIIEQGESKKYLIGQVVNRSKIIAENEKLEKTKKNPIKFEDLIIGISRIAIKTDSFLSAASFQETTSVLIDAAIQGKYDYLKGLKENVIIGRLIPAGTSFRAVSELEND
jgi:DNA-directed RNA polymerase subunit beta'